MTRYTALVALWVLLAVPVGLAHPEDPSTVDPIGEATVTVTYNGPHRPTSFGIELTRSGTSVTDGELFVQLDHPGTGEVLDRRVLEPGPDGVYRLHAPLEPGTAWTLRFYHGYGFEAADAIVEGGPVPASSHGTEVLSEPIYAFYPDAPQDLNLWGYSAYGVLMAGALVGVGALVRRIEAAELRPTRPTGASQRPQRR